MALKRSHRFWAYLASAAQSVIVAFVHMLWRAQEKHASLRSAVVRFVELVSARGCGGQVYMELCASRFAQSGASSFAHVF